MPLLPGHSTGLSFGLARATYSMTMNPTPVTTSEFSEREREREMPKLKNSINEEEDMCLDGRWTRISISWIAFNFFSLWILYLYHMYKLPLLTFGVGNIFSQTNTTALANCGLWCTLCLWPHLLYKHDNTKSSTLAQAVGPRDVSYTSIHFCHV